MRLSLLLSLLLILPLVCRAASADSEREYAEVRKIALKDPKVQEAYRKAEERLDAKILEIDPSLKPIVDEHTRTAEAGPAPRPAATASRVAGAQSASRHYVVVSGDTLSSIAAHYKVKVSALEKANHITDARDLKIGQRLVIPQAGLDESEPAASASPAPAAGSLLDRIKSDL